MRYFLVSWIILSAQPLPDKIVFRRVSGDTLHADCFTFQGGWMASIWQVQAGQSQPWRRDSFFVDSLRRLRLYLSYTFDQQAYQPTKRWRIDYPEARQVTFTEEFYEQSLNSFIPKRRFTLWRGASQWDSLLRSWLGIMALNWSHYEGAMPIPHPSLSERTLWGDSLLVEEFDSGAQVYVAVGGYAKRSGGACDTFLIYDQQGLNRVERGFYALCVLAGDKLRYIRDTFCTLTDCITTERFFSYDGMGLLVIDSVVLRVYTPQGQPVSQGSFPKRYFWDTQGRLNRAIYAGGEYELTYGNQIVALNEAGTLLGERNEAQKPEEMVVYDWQGRVVWQGEIPPGERFQLPLELPSGVYLCRVRNRVIKAVRQVP
ncbi:MAG: hypothetical protein ABDH66_02950 [Bacteroidia bacterium]